jgi:transcription termination/antitermination protein NusA
MQDGYDSLTALPGVGISLADALYERGFYSAEELSNASAEDLTNIRGIGESKALKLIETATDYMAGQEILEETLPEASSDDTAESDDPHGPQEASATEMPQASEDDLVEGEDTSDPTEPSDNPLTDE